jgi:hypothetical protein
MKVWLKSMPITSLKDRAISKEERPTAQPKSSALQQHQQQKQE